MHRYRTHTCGRAAADHIVHGRGCRGLPRMRDHAVCCFIDLRDHYGLTQIVADLTRPPSDRRRSCAPNGSSCRLPGARGPAGTDNPDPPCRPAP